MKRFINQDDMRQANASDIFREIRKEKNVTRKQLEIASGLSWGTVSAITAALLSHGYITEQKRERAGGSGRNPLTLEVNGGGHFVIGLDINISGLTAELVNLKNESLRRWKCVPDYSGKEEFLKSIFGFTESVFGGCGDFHILALGAAVQGVSDTATGMSVCLPMCPGWKNIPLADTLSRRFNLPVYLEHDPNCILLAAAEKEKLNNAVLFRIDGGVGLAVMTGGKILYGNGMLEIAHTTVVPGGELCSCGSKGCLEAYASQNGLCSRAGCGFDELVEKARRGDAAAAGLFEDMALYLGMAANNARYMFNADEILLCGSMLRYRDLFLDRFTETVHASKFLSADKNTKITVIDTEDASRGAALAAIDRSIKSLII